jgi:ATP-dependent RNA helicase RhlE
VEKIRQKAMMVEKADKDALLMHLLEQHPEWNKVIVFTKMRHGADRINKKLMRRDEASAVIHSDKTQAQRTRALKGFREGSVRVLVATDIASRGIDVPEVSAVINMELPLETESYVHRIGRTARAGEEGVAISFVSQAEKPQLKAVERFIKKTIPVDGEHPFAANGKNGANTPEWVHPANRNRNNRKRQKHVSFQGRRQPDFGQKAKNRYG